MWAKEMVCWGAKENWGLLARPFICDQNSGLSDFEWTHIEVIKRRDFARNNFWVWFWLIKLWGLRQILNLRKSTQKDHTLLSFYHQKCGVLSARLEIKLYSVIWGKYQTKNTKADFFSCVFLSVSQVSCYPKAASTGLVFVHYCLPILFHAFSNFSSFFSTKTHHSIIFPLSFHFNQQCILMNYSIHLYIVLSLFHYIIIIF